MFRIVTCRLVMLTSYATNLELLLSREAACEPVQWGNVYISVFYICDFYP